MKKILLTCILSTALFSLTGCFEDTNTATKKAESTEKKCESGKCGEGKCSNGTAKPK